MCTFQISWLSREFFSEEWELGKWNTRVEVVLHVVVRISKAQKSTERLRQEQCARRMQKILIGKGEVLSDIAKANDGFDPC